MDNTKKILHLIKAAIAIIAVSTLASCGPYRYFPTRVQFYSFDTCKEVRIVLEPYINGLQLGYNIGGAYSITKHFALAANYHHDHSRPWENEEIGAPLGYSTGNAYNLGVGYFYKLNQNNGFDLFFKYEHERVNGQQGFYDYTNNSPLDTINYKYHSFSLQTSRYGKINNSIGIAAGVSGTVLVDNSFSNDTTPDKITITRHYKLGAFILTPGFDVKLYFLHLGLYYNFDLAAKKIPENFYRPLVLNAKLVIPIPFNFDIHDIFPKSRRKFNNLNF